MIDFIQRLLNGAKEYVLRQKTIPGCGVWPFVTPSWDIFYEFCVVHDADYGLSTDLYTEGVLENNPEKRERAMAMKLETDDLFAEYCRQRASKSFILFRGITQAWAELYIGLVYKNSREIWFYSIGHKVAQHEMENNPDVSTRSESLPPALYGRNIVRRVL